MKILLEILVVAVLWIAASRLAPKSARGGIINVLKAWVTVRAFWLLLEHPVTLEDGSTVVAWELIVQQMQTLDAATFWTWTLMATAIKFVGILASMSRWQILLAGQGIELPFQHIFGSFLIGRFIGTFLPSTAGLDGYKLYDAARFSGRTVEATAATALEKVLGVTGIFLSFLVALPFGIKIFGEQAGTVALVTVPISVGVIGGLLALLWYPTAVQWILTALPLPGKARLEGLVMRISRSTAAYADKKGLVLTALFLSFVVHFTTAAMYYFTALAVGAGDRAEFWPLVFGSSIQIFATVLAPTMGGVGAREWAQLVTLGHMIGPAAAIVSAALGFWAAEGLTLLGGVFWWMRTEAYRPAYCRVEGEQVDYAQAAAAAVDLLGKTPGRGEAGAGDTTYARGGGRA
ncbi:MAG TPA: lysylphosphatidylglycerol synthase transmembrane domain-containing protein [Candidatus Limnocylindrales bacterium]|nr:lysylphosphatidylglycerol synthase transmembrane domain-containing protein [Candidatus Limnocylindrales bacterium]